MAGTAKGTRAPSAKAKRVGAARRQAPGAPDPNVRAGIDQFPTPDRYTCSGHTLGDICFECECRILQIGGPEGLLLAWCECGYPEDHTHMEVL